MFFDSIIVYKLAGESNSAFARRLGISPSRLCSWKHFNPKLKTLFQLAHILDVTPGSLLREEDENK